MEIYLEAEVKAVKEGKITLHVILGTREFKFFK